MRWSLETGGVAYLRYTNPVKTVVSVLLISAAVDYDQRSHHD